MSGSRRRTVLSLARLSRYALLTAPILFVVTFLLAPLGLTFVLSFWERAGFKLRPAFSLASYETFFTGVRLTVLEKSLVLGVVDRPAEIHANVHSKFELGGTWQQRWPIHVEEYEVGQFLL